VTGIDTRKKFIDKEKDRETGTANHGVRQYDPEIGAFPSPDPLWEQYLAFTPYQYAANTPTGLADRNGMEVDVLNLVLNDSQDGTTYMTEIMNDLSSKTGLALYVDANGLLQYDKSKTNTSIGSKIARNLLTQAIDNSTRVVVESAYQDRSGADTRGQKMWLNMAQTKFGIDNTYGADPTTYGFAMSFLHELLHTALGPNGGLTDEGYKGIGEVETVLNDVRRELGPQYGQRLMYEARAFLQSGSAYIPFSYDALRSINANIEPSSGMYVMTRVQGKEE